MSNKKTNRSTRLLCLVLAVTLTLSSCAFIRKEPAYEPNLSETVQTSQTTESENETPIEEKTEAESETEKESISTEETFEIELEPITEEVTETEEETVVYYETMIIEEDIFGDYVAPETEPPETEMLNNGTDVTVPETDYDFPEYDPTVPSGNGHAPLALMYHLVLDEPFSELESLFVRPAELEGHIQALIEKGYAFIFADEYAYSDRKTVIMSFDDGYIDNYTEMFPIIKKYNVKVTVFMVAGYIGGGGYLDSAMIKEMADSGLVSFQSHTVSHAGLPSLSPDSQRYEFARSKEIIESITGREVKAICYPSGRFNDGVLAVASEYFEFGYTTVSRMSTAGYPALELPRLRVSRGMSKSYFKGLLP